MLRVFLCIKSKLKYYSLPIANNAIYYLINGNGETVRPEFTTQAIFFCLRWRSKTASEAHLWGRGKFKSTIDEKIHQTVHLGNAFLYVSYQGNVSVIRFHIKTSKKWASHEVQCLIVSHDAREVLLIHKYVISINQFIGAPYRVSLNKWPINSIGVITSQWYRTGFLSYWSVLQWLDWDFPHWGYASSFFFMKF